MFQGQGEEKFLPCLRIFNTWVEFHFSQLPASRLDSYFLITPGWIQSSLSQPDSFHSPSADRTFLGRFEITWHPDCVHTCKSERLLFRVAPGMAFSCALSWGTTCLREGSRGVCVLVALCRGLCAHLSQPKTHRRETLVLSGAPLACSWLLPAVCPRGAPAISRRRLPGTRGRLRDALVAPVQEISAVWSRPGQVKAAGVEQAALQEAGWRSWTLSSESGPAPLPSSRAPGTGQALRSLRLSPPRLRWPRPSIAAWMGSLGSGCCRSSGSVAGRVMQTSWPGWKLLSPLSPARVVVPGCYELLNRCCGAPSEGCISLGEEMNPFNSGHNL